MLYLWLWSSCVHTPSPRNALSPWLSPLTPIRVSPSASGMQCVVSACPLADALAMHTSPSLQSACPAPSYPFPSSTGHL